jgi:hypothetical protein
MNRAQMIRACAGLAALAALAAAAQGCPAKGSSGAPSAADRPHPEVIREARQDMPDGHSDTAALNVLSRGPRRMSVEQIERSIERIAQLPVGTVKLQDTLTLALGRPDYLRVTDESLEPSPLFMKFMMDLGAGVCTNLSDSDPMRPPEQRALTRFADRDENIRYLLLRFTGIEGPEADGYVSRLKAVYEVGSRGARAQGGWEAVCMALFASPEFLLY